MEETFKKLAERNGWNYSLTDGRPYFTKNGTYAIPDENTSDEDKELLANIISEGSSEMAQLIRLCWDNGIIISGPCSGIKEFHNKQPFSLHFSFKAPKELIDSLYESMKEVFPSFEHMYRENCGLIRYDIDYFLGGKELSMEESNEIFAIIRAQLQAQLQKKEIKKH